MLAAAAAVGAIVLALAIGLGGGGSSAFGVVELPDYLNPDGRSVGVQQGELIADFELETLDGGHFRLSDWRGHPILLNFWASWCGPCRAEMPALVQLSERFRGEGLIVVGVNMNESTGDAQDFVDEFGVRFAVPMDRGGKVTDRFLQIGPPNSYFIDQQGIVRQSLIGGATPDVFAARVGVLLAELSTPLGPLPAPGLKAVPTPLLSDEAEVAVARGAVAPDFVLAAGGDGRWRLTEQRGIRLLVHFQPGTCAACGDAAEAARQAAADAGLRFILVARGNAAGETGGILLRWDESVGDLYAPAGRQRSILIDADGVVRGAVAADDDVAGAIAEAFATRDERT